MVDVRFELTTNDPWSVDDAICECISPLGYWQKVNQSPTQTKPYNTLPPFEQREGFDFGFPCLRACVVLQFAFLRLALPATPTIRGRVLTVVGLAIAPF